MASRLLSSAMPLIQSLLRSLAAASSPAAGRWSPFIQSTSTIPQTLLRPAALSVALPSLIADIWESVLRAVPKKKVSHMKRRHRQLAGKALKDVKNLNSCPGCGQTKRSHVLCSHCVSGMSLWYLHRMICEVTADHGAPIDIKKQWGKTQTA